MTSGDQVSLPEPGELLDQKYRIVRRLGTGGMGVVFQAEHVRLGQSVAIKMLLPHARQREMVARFAREARAAGQLRSPHAVRVMDVAETADGVPYMVMELLEGRDLSQELDDCGRLPTQSAVDYVLEAAEAMVEAHACGIVHRDLKPSNLFLAIEGDVRVVKVCDFGISKMQTTAADERLTATQTSIGTPLYMSPEQVRCSKDVDERTDVWSLGVILYELVSGSAPFTGGSVAALGASIVSDPPLPLPPTLKIPAALERAIGVALAKDPKGRYPSMDAFIDAFAPFGTPGRRRRSTRSALPSGSTVTAPATSSAALEAAATLIASNPGLLPLERKAAPPWPRRLVVLAVVLPLGALAATVAVTGVRARVARVTAEAVPGAAPGVSPEPLATPSSSVSAPSASVSAPSASVSAPSASVSAPSASVSAPSASVSAPSASVSAPSASVSAPSGARSGGAVAPSPRAPREPRTTPKPPPAVTTRPAPPPVPTRL